VNEITTIAAQPISAVEQFGLQQRQARMFALSPLVPEHLRKGSEESAIANCYIALKLAEVMGEAPLVVMQNIHVVKGKAGFAAQYMIARANNSGVFRGRIDWRINRDDPKNLSVTAWAALRETGEEVSFTCDMAMAKAEGWTSNPKYTSMPELMLRYRSATFLVRLYAPDVMLGYQTVEEVSDMGAIDTPARPKLTGAMLAEQAAVEPEAVETVEAEEVEQGRSDEQHGDQFDGNEPECEASVLPGWIADDQRIRDLISTAHSLADVKEAMLELDRVRVTIPDAQCAELDGLIADKRRELQAAC
jgi:hypothetical protein